MESRIRGVDVTFQDEKYVIYNVPHELVTLHTSYNISCTPEVEDRLQLMYIWMLKNNITCMEWDDGRYKEVENGPNKF
ncbi:hypothetical protein D3C75_1038840 [compost metagenome]